MPSNATAPPPTHPLLLNDQTATEVADALQNGYNLLEAVNLRLKRQLDAYDKGATGPGQWVTLEDIGRMYSLLDDLHVQHAQTGRQVDEFADHLSHLNGARLDLALTN